MVDRYDEMTLLGYIEGDLPPQQKAQLDQALAQDDRLRGLLEQLIRDRAALRGVTAEEPPQRLMDQVHQRLEREMLLDNPLPQEKAATPTSSRHIGRWVAVTGLAALVLLGVGLILQNVFDTLKLQEPGASPTSVAANQPAPAAEGLALALKERAAEKQDQGRASGLAGAGAKSELNSQGPPALSESPAVLDRDGVLQRNREFTGAGGGAGRRSAQQQPPLRIQLASNNPLTSENDLLAWAKANRVTYETIGLSAHDARAELNDPITGGNRQKLNESAQNDAAAADEEKNRRADDDRHTSEARSNAPLDQADQINSKSQSFRQVNLRVAPSKVNELMVYLNSRTGQSARLVQDVPSDQQQLGALEKAKDQEIDAAAADKVAGYSRESSRIHAAPEPGSVTEADRLESKKPQAASAEKKTGAPAQAQPAETESDITVPVEIYPDGQTPSP